jgi:hypothetical protein
MFNHCFLITSRRFSDTEHVKPVPSGSTRTFFTVLSSITNAYLKKEILFRFFLLNDFTEMIEHYPIQLSYLFQDLKPKIIELDYISIILFLTLVNLASGSAKTRT